MSYKKALTRLTVLTLSLVIFVCSGITDEQLLVAKRAGFDLKRLPY